MKTLTVFLLFLGITAIFASKSSSKNLEKIRKDDFGQALLSLIDMNMRLKTPVSDVQDELSQILANLKADYQLVVNNYGVQSDVLNNAIANGKTLLNGYQSAIHALGSSLESDQNTIADKQTSLDNTQSALTADNNLLATLETNYQQYVPNAQATINDLANAINAIQTAIARMQTYQNSGVEQSIFIQVSSNLRKDLKKATDVLETMKQSVSKTSSVYTPIVQELLDLTENLTQDKAQKIISLLEQLLALLQTSATNTQSQLATFISVYQSQKDQATNEVVTYTALIAQLNTDIGNLSQRLQTSQQDINNNIQLRDDTQAKLISDQARLDQLNDSYSQEDDRYKRLIPLIQTVIDYFNTNVAGADSYAVDAANSA